MKNKTLDYYNQNAADFFEGTCSVDMSHLYEAFLQYIPDKGYILDLGCGSGRDSKHFTEKDYHVTAIDGSKELCALASKHIGQEVLCMDFAEVDFEDAFDGIWACASLLHVDRTSIKVVLARLHRSLKAGGTMYLSFKEGIGEREKDGRFFNDYTEDSLKILLESCEFSVERMFITGDVREGRSSVKWVNGIVKKNE